MGLYAKVKQVKIPFQPAIVYIGAGSEIVVHKQEGQKNINYVLLDEKGEAKLKELERVITEMDQRQREVLKRIEIRVNASHDRFDALVKEALGDAKKPLAMHMKRAPRVS